MAICKIPNGASSIGIPFVSQKRKEALAFILLSCAVKLLLPSSIDTSVLVNLNFEPVSCHISIYLVLNLQIFPGFLLREVALWCGIPSRLVLTWWREVYFWSITEALRLYFGVILGMGILLSYPLIHTCSLFVTFSFLLDGIRWLIIRRFITWALLLVTDGRILLIGC